MFFIILKMNVNDNKCRRNRIIASTLKVWPIHMIATITSNAQKIGKTKCRNKWKAKSHTENDKEIAVQLDSWHRKKLFLICAWPNNFQRAYETIAIRHYQIILDRMLHQTNRQNYLVTFFNVKSEHVEPNKKKRKRTR